MSRNSALVLVLALGSLISPAPAFAQLTPPAGSAGAGNSAISGVPFGPANPRVLSDPAASEMPHLSRRSAPTPRRHRCPTDRSIRYRRRARASSRRLTRARHSGLSARITSSQEVRHRSAGEVAHRSARSRGFAGGVRARLTWHWPLSIPLLSDWSLLVFGVVPFRAA
jgi:hypothetical protein